jgi:N-dimethylarginine dimethylaminohydrolase
MNTPRILMCRPDHYGIEYEINPWMSRDRSADRDRAITQWEALVDLLGRLGATIERLEPVAGLPDMVFTANAGVVQRNVFVPANFRHRERQGESAHFIRWFAERGWEIRTLPESMSHEGAGDALFCGGTLFCGYIFRSEVVAHDAIAVLLGCESLSLELVDPRFYHLDTCFCPLAPGAAIWYPEAFDEYARTVIERNIPVLVRCDDESAVRFGCNAVVIGREVTLNTGTDGLASALASAGFRAHQTDLSEFIKAGGSAKCLTLRLDGEEAAGWKRG